MQYLIGYDIRNEKRLVRAYKKITRYATPIQYSIFLFDGTLTGLRQCLEEVLIIINKKEDDLRVYPLPTNGKQWRLGKPALPEGIIWTVLPKAIDI